ncbi:MAG TPA: hypothetical protein VHG30_15180 [Microvirga sp.]|nr:hypothetical protein [Microvirga sp.]
MQSGSVRRRYTSAFAECLIAGAAAIMERSYGQFYSCLIQDIMRTGLACHVRWSALHRSRIRESYLLALLAAATSSMRGEMDPQLLEAIEEGLHRSLQYPSDVVPGSIGDLLKAIVREAESCTAAEGRSPAESVARSVVRHAGVLGAGDARDHVDDRASFAALAGHLATLGSDWWRTVDERAHMAA